MTGPKRAIAGRQQGNTRPRGTPGGEPEPVRVWLLGSFRVSVGSRSIGEEGWRLKKAAALVKLLALAPAHRMHREQAMELLWPDLEPEAALNNLHHALHIARRTLEPSAPPSGAASRYLRLRDEQLALCPEGPLLVDVEAFEGAAATARRSREPAAYRAAVELYVGDLLPEDRYEPWTEEKREELRRLYHALLLELAGVYEEREEYTPAIEVLQRVVVEEPSYEEAHLGLMRLYALSGWHHEAILQYERLRKALREELGEEPSEAGRRLYQEIRAWSFPAAPTPSPSSFSAGATHPPEEPAQDSSLNNLPASLTSFVGREREMLEVKRALSMTRLLTLSGTGGSGKTRLALEVARDLVSTYPEGVWLVELAPLSDPGLLAQAVAQALGVHEQPGRSLTQTLSNYLEPRQTLLVVDNCEHLIDAAAHLMEELLRSCPKLQVLATSRELLNVPGEVVWAVPPLSLPEGDQEEESTVEGLVRYEAVRLFIDRARSRLPDFELTQQNAGAVGRVCRKLEGIPLAIELASARMGMLAVEQVAQRLEGSLKLLSSGARTVDPRHQTLRATLDWSFGLLSEVERRLFGRLSVFAGGWTLEAAEEVCSGEGIDEEDVVDLLSKLVEKSLVVTEAPSSSGAGSGEAWRFRMLEPIRQYGRERIEEIGESEVVRSQHAGYYLALAERVEPELMGSRPKAALGRLELERGNLRAALSWALDADEEDEEEAAERAEVGLRLAAALGQFWDAQGAGEGRRWLEKGLAKSDAAPKTSVRVKALNEAGFIAVYQGDPQAMALLEESLALSKELGDKSGMAYSLRNLGHAIVHGGDRERIPALREEAEALLSESLGRRETALLLNFLGLAATSELDLEQMKTYFEEALVLFRDLGDVRSLAQCLVALGLIPLSQGDSERAAVYFEESLLLTKELNKTAIFFGLAGMAGVAALRGQPVRVAKLFGALEALREEIGLSRAPLSLALYDGQGVLATAQVGLSEAAFETAFSEGQAMTLEEAIEYALSKQEEERDLPTLVSAPEQQQQQQESPVDEPTERLSAREEEVALLVGRGLTNRRIASELSISERTVENHVRKILRKLGFASRARIAAWVAQR